MSLFIRACVRKMTPEQFKQKYKISVDEFDEMSMPFKEHFAYHLHPELFVYDSNVYQEIEEAYESIDSDQFSFRIGYSGFEHLRVDLCTAMNFELIGNDVSWKNISFTEKESKAIYNFMTHLHCDGRMTYQDVHYLLQAINKQLDKNRVKEDKSINEKRINDFVSFLSKADAKKCYLVFS